jgi:aryl-alcohol dehydrogenase-like predicted oxidoreductase
MKEPAAVSLESRSSSLPALQPTGNPVAGKLGLGTVQFGLSYGVTNHRGQTPESEVMRILAEARKAGISMLDTAALYGNSETVLGDALTCFAGTPFRIVTKTPKWGKDSIHPEDADRLEHSLLESLRKLRCSCIYGLLLHHCEDATAPGGELLFERMVSLRTQGLVGKIGVSAYSPKQVDAVIARHTIDLVQVPFNVIDQRFRTSGCFSRLKQRGIEIHTRSAFLQGSLLVDPKTLPPHFEKYLPLFRQFREVCAAQGLSPLSVALQFVLNQKEVDCCIFGVTTAAEFQQILQSVTLQAVNLDFEALPSDDETLVNPTHWKGRP